MPFLLALAAALVVILIPAFLRVLSRGGIVGFKAPDWNFAATASVAWLLSFIQYSNAACKEPQVNYAWSWPYQVAGVLAILCLLLSLLVARMAEEAAPEGPRPSRHSVTILTVASAVAAALSVVTPLTLQEMATHGGSIRWIP